MQRLSQHLHHLTWVMESWDLDQIPLSSWSTSRLAYPRSFCYPCYFSQLGYLAQPLHTLRNCPNPRSCHWYVVHWLLDASFHPAYPQSLAMAGTKALPMAHQAAFKTTHRLCLRQTDCFDSTFHLDPTSFIPVWRSVMQLTSLGSSQQDSSYQHYSLRSSILSYY